MAKPTKRDPKRIAQPTKRPTILVLSQFRLTNEPNRPCRRGGWGRGGHGPRRRASFNEGHGRGWRAEHGSRKEGFGALHP